VGEARERRKRLEQRVKEALEGLSFRRQRDKALFMTDGRLADRGQEPLRAMSPTAATAPCSNSTTLDGRGR
jgi:hypothetical protein